MIKRIIQFVSTMLSSKVGWYNYLKIKANKASASTCVINGSKYSYSNGNVFIAQYEHIFTNHLYKFSTQADSELLILDCGANIGMATLYFKKEYPNSQVIAFEPDPKNFAILKNNVTDNNLTKVTLVEKAIWVDSNGVNFENNNNLGSKINNADANKHSITPSVSLNDIIESNDKIDFLKLDIEAAEADVIESCKNNLHKIDKMFIEYHAAPNEPQRLQHILSILSEQGFRYYIKEDCSITVNPFATINPIWGFDLQLQIFAYKNK